MAVVHLQQALRSLCTNTGWCYAVFWKLKRRSRMMLTWEDVYYDNFKSTSASNSNTIFECGGNPLNQGGSSDLEGQIGLAVAKMSYYVFSMGEGIIGRVAFTGKHQWVFHSTALDTGAPNNPMSPEKYPDGWQNQFAAGIKTIAVIAVSQGVVQLGSVQLMPEDVKWIDHVKSVFAALQASATTPLREGPGTKVLAHDTPLNFGATTSTTMRKPFSSQHNLHSNEHIYHALNYGLRPNTVMTRGLLPELQQQHMMQMLGDVQELKRTPAQPVSQVSQRSNILPNQVTQNLLYGDDKCFSFVQNKTIEGAVCPESPMIKPGKRTVSTNRHESLGNVCLPPCQQNLVNEHDQHMSDVTKNEGISTLSDSSASLYQQSGQENSLNMPCKGIDLLPTNKVTSQDKQNDVHHMQFPSFNPSFPVATTVNEELPLKTEPLAGVDANIFNQVDMNTLDELESFIASVSKQGNFNWDSAFAIGDELSQALGPAFKKETMSDQKTDVTGEIHLAHPYFSKNEIMQKWDSRYGSGHLLLPQMKTEPLLDAVVANASQSHQCMSSHTDDSFSGNTFHSNSMGTKEMDSIMGMHSSKKQLQGTVYDGTKTPVIGKTSHGYQSLCLSNTSSANVAFSGRTEDSQSLKSDDAPYSQPKTSQDSARVGKKRARSGDGARPRPKDRQQIQDRVRELREIIPNGSKCSIDSLLEKTIKHMQFLQSVTIHADQLKKNGELTDLECSWALDLDSHEPIVVKDLNQPRQMLVMIMCEDKGLFLEIADTIRGLGLTILKGIMEAHKDKVWAKFYVESNREMQRVEVLMSLLSRLNISNNSSSSSMTMASQSVPGRSQPGVETSSSQTFGR